MTEQLVLRQAQDAGYSLRSAPSEFSVWPGVPYPQGSSYDGEGVNFAVFSENAEKLEVCLFDPDAPQKETARVRLADKTGGVWHGYIPGLKPGALYGFRAHGPFDPEKGARFNPHKLLVDPYARAISGKLDWNAPVFGYPIDSTDEDRDLLSDLRDSGPGIPRSVVVDEAFDWGNDRRPEHLWRRSVMYELHVKGFTALHPEIPPELRGTYAGLAHPAAIAHLQKLGVTSLELLPVHEAISEGTLVAKGLSNFWGYNTLGFFAPDQRFSSQGSRGGQVREFKQMVKALHAAGLEIILDVVYNHTCEGNHYGPTLSMRGLGNEAYYWLNPKEPRYYQDFTGCGNSVNASKPQALKLILDSLRYWVQDMHVDGFRFDLATTLGRTGDGEFNRLSPFFLAVHQDPILSRVKLIAEPWDLGHDGYKVGNFPAPWAEWNGKYRDTIRRYWRGDESQAAEVGYRISGSSDLFKISTLR